MILYVAADIMSNTIGVWHSLVVRLVRDQEAAGSNPVTPTKQKAGLVPAFLFGRCDGQEKCVQAAREGRAPVFCGGLRNSATAEFNVLNPVTPTKQKAGLVPASGH